MSITQLQKLHLKRRAHDLKPVVLLGQHGLTDAVLKAIDEALEAHELIKVKLSGVEREQVAEMQAAICESLRADVVSQIGHMLVLYRKTPAAAVVKKAEKIDKKRVKKRVAKFRKR